MNQILYSEHENVINNSKKKQRKFKLLLYISIFSIFCILSYFSYSSYITNKKEKFSKKLLNNFNLERLYYEKEEYIPTDIHVNNDIFVIGIIQIPKINIEYPILSHTNDELLKIAPCRFYGPYPNQKGNLCIAAHNYDDDRFFSNLNKLVIGDLVNILDSNKNMISYQIYKKYEISKNDFSCTSQNTNQKREITLITCNNFNGNRLIVKASEFQKK